MQKVPAGKNMGLGYLIKLVWVSAWFTFWALSAPAQDFSALARIDSVRSAITNAGSDSVQVDLRLSQGVPFRVFTLSRPDRLVIDFREVDWTGLTSETLLQSQKIVEVRFGSYRPGWSRLVAQMAQPMAVADVAMTLQLRPDRQICRCLCGRSAARPMMRRPGLRMIHVGICLPIPWTRRGKIKRHAVWW